MRVISTIFNLVRTYIQPIINQLYKRYYAVMHMVLINASPIIQYFFRSMIGMSILFTLFSIRISLV